ncbi:MAG: alpha/beta hydrolase [Actinomycetota bacterium]
MPSIHANGVTLEYETHGDGEPLLLITGLAGQLIDWELGFVRLLEEQGFRVIRFDNRDSGLSTKFSETTVRNRDLLSGILSRRQAPAPYVIEDMAADASALLDGLGIGSAHIVGASMGGMIAQAMAIAEPSRVRSLTSIMSHTGDRRNGRVSARLMLRLPFLGRTNERNAIDKGVQLAQALSGDRFDPHEARRRVMEAVERSWDPAAGERQSLALFASRDRTPLLRRLNVPALVIHGRRDPLVLPSGGRATARAIPDAELLEFPEMGHELPEHRWTDIAQAIRRNAERVVRPALVG